MTRMILVSACLLGHKVKYDGKENTHGLLVEYNARGRFLAVCPECLARLPVPRPPMEIQAATGKQVLSGGAKVCDANGKDTTAYFIEGASRVLQMAQAYHVKVAILKESSPSCGVHTVYDGTFAGRKTRGMGVTAALLIKNGVRCYAEQDLTAALLESLIAEDVAQDSVSS